MLPASPVHSNRRFHGHAAFTALQVLLPSDDSQGTASHFALTLMLVSKSVTVAFPWDMAVVTRHTTISGDRLGLQA